VCACFGLKLPQCQIKPYKQKQQLLLRDLLPVAGVAICLCLVLSALFLSKRKITVDEMETAGLCVCQISSISEFHTVK
jgi:hypothetical protein